jgi:hypothetical protein
MIFKITYFTYKFAFLHFPVAVFPGFRIAIQQIDYLLVGDICLSYMFDVLSFNGNWRDLIIINTC